MKKSKPSCLTDEQWLTYLRIKIKYDLRKISKMRKNCLPNENNFGIIKVQNFNMDSFPNHEGVKGQLGGSKKRGVPDGVTKFETKNGKMKITSDLSVKASKSGKTSVTIKAGTDITGVYVFAGKGARKPLNVATNIASQYGGKPKDWMHSCGFADVVTADGETHSAEIHWFENDDVGQIKFKVKKR